MSFVIPVLIGSCSHPAGPGLFGGWRSSRETAIPCYFNVNWLVFASGRTGPLRRLAALRRNRNYARDFPANCVMFATGPARPFWMPAARRRCRNFLCYSSASWLNFAFGRAGPLPRLAALQEHAMC